MLSRFSIALPKSRLVPNFGCNTWSPTGPIEFTVQLERCSYYAPGICSCQTDESAPGKAPSARLPGCPRRVRKYFCQTYQTRCGVQRANDSTAVIRDRDTILCESVTSSLPGSVRRCMPIYFHLLHAPHVTLPQSPNGGTIVQTAWFSTVLCSGGRPHESLSLGVFARLMGHET
jgi:hypothetical protein